MVRRRRCVLGTLGVLLLVSACEPRGTIAAAEMAPETDEWLLQQTLAELASLRGSIDHLTARADAADAAAAALVERVRLLEQCDCCGSSAEAAQPEASSSWLHPGGAPIHEAATEHSEGRRQAQTDEAVLDPTAAAGHSYVRLIKRNATVAWGSGLDPDLDGAESQRQCGVGSLPSRTDAINLECCDEPSEDCSGGYPRTCNAGCAALFLPFWRNCRDALGKSSQLFEPAVQVCERASASAAPLAARLPLQCTDGTAEECIPECNAARHGWSLLLSVDGDDAWLSCLLDHGHYSWSGPVGGFLGSDVQPFLSAVLTGAPGWYFITLTDDQAVETALTVGLGQSVSVSGNPELPHATAWDSGQRVGGWQAFTISGDGMLSLSNMAVHGMIRISSEARMLAIASTFGGSVALDRGSTAVANASTFRADVTTNGGSITLTGCVLNTTTSSLRASGYGPGVRATISLRQMAVPSGVLSSALSQLTSPGATLQMSEVLVSDWTDVPLSGVATVGESGALQTQPPDLLSVMPVFVVNSGPCTVSKDGRCVGRAEGYNRLERCSIAVGGVVTVTLGSCSVFDTDTDHYDRVSWGSGVAGKSFDGSDCPEGEQLRPGQEISWSSDSGRQGSVGQEPGNGCAGKGLCGLPWSLAGLGGGWEICAE